MSDDSKPAPFEPAPAWEQRYEENSTRWERGALNPAFEHWRDTMAFAGLDSVIVPGCGRSPEPLALACMGLAVTALDFAPSPIAYQQQAFREAGLDAAIAQADVLQWQPEAPADAVYDQTCLCALTPAVWPDYAAQLQRWLKPGGKAFMLFMQTGQPGGPPFDCPLDAMHELFDEQHWQWPGTPPFRSGHSGGKVELGAVLTRR